VRYDEEAVLKSAHSRRKKMSLQVERLEHNMAKLTIEVPAEEVEKALQSSLSEAERGKISLSGIP
jgi:hypothetical protein